MRPDKPAGARLTRKDVLLWEGLARAAEKRLDLSEYDLSGADLHDVALRDVIFGDHAEVRKGARTTDLRAAIFRGSRLEHCFFAHVDLEDADFRGCTISRCDFRYATFHRTTLENATLELCDLYRAIIMPGTVMLDTKLELVSLTASLEGATDLRWTAFARKGRPPALVAEDANEYPKFLEWTKEDRYETYPIKGALDDRLDAAARTYRNLCAHWTSRGQFHDAGKAYVHARRLEREEAGPLFKGKTFRPLTWMWLWIADALCGFGESLLPIFFWLLVVALAPGVLYAIFGGLHGAKGLGNYLLFSIEQLTDATPGGITSANHLVDLVGTLQRISGVALLGLFGFVLGNRIRSS